MASSTRDGVFCTRNHKRIGRHCERGGHGKKYMGEYPRKVQAFEREAEYRDFTERRLPVVRPIRSFIVSALT